jgi:hypothetical protein
MPTWLLFDADWMHTRQSAPFMPHLRKIVSVGRVKWIPDSPFTGKDNCCWYLFDQTSAAPAAIRRKSRMTTYLMVTHIQALVAAYYKIPVREMTSERRHREVSHPRQVAMYLAYELTPKSLPDIGKRFGDRDHTTVIHAIRQVKKRIIEDHEIYADVQALRERLAA